MSNAPAWVTLAAGLGSGVAGSSFGFWQARKVLPATRRQIEAEADRASSQAIKSAMETVEEALNVARGRIENLQSQVTTLTTHIGELRGRLDDARSDRARIEEALNIALSERAKLQQQIMDINRRVGTRRIDDLVGLAPPDAIVMMDLETGKIVYANEGVYALLGYVPSRLIGEDLEFLVPDGQRGQHKGLRAAYSHSPQQRRMGQGLPLYVRPNGGGRIPVDISLHPTGDGRVIALVKRRTEAPAPDEPAELVAASAAVSGKTV